jgi:tyrosine-protein phosphatase SIW14
MLASVETSKGTPMECIHFAAQLRILCCVALIAGCAMPPATPPTRSWVEPCDTCIAGVVNFAKVTPRLWRGSQPTEAGFRNLEKAGAKTILSLRDQHDDFSLLEGTKLKYLRIPMHAWHPEEAEIVLLLKVLERVLQDPDSWPVYVHCAEGRDRTGYGIATYRVVVENWTANDAIHEMFGFRFNAVWFRNPAFLRELDVERIRALMKRAP